MKKLVFPVLALVLPVLVFASAFGTKALSPIGFKINKTDVYRLAQQIMYEYDSVDWTTQMRVNHYYNQEYPDMPDSMIVDFYDHENMQWVEGVYSAYATYNDFGHILEFNLSLGWEGIALKGVPQYDDQHRLTKFFTYTLEQGIEEWMPSSRLHIIYGAGTTFEVFGWDNPYDSEEEYDSYFRSMFIFDDAGRILEEISFASQDSLTWRHDGKSVYTYHPQDTTSGESFIEYIAVYLPLSYMMDSFDFPGKIIAQEWFWWSGDDWVPGSKDLTEFDDEIRKTVTTQYYRDGFMDEWIPDYRKLFTYDQNGNQAEQIDEYHYDNQFWPIEKVEFIWETYTSVTDPALAPVADLHINAYPVPFSDQVKIRLDSSSKAELKLRIYNARGQIVRQFSAPAGTTLTWDGRAQNGRPVASGIYYLRANQGNLKATSKILHIK